MSNIIRMPNILLASRAHVRGVHEHTVTRSARKDPLDPMTTIVNKVSLGYFIHLDFGPESGPLSFGCGPTPLDVKAGEAVIVAILRESKTDIG